MTTFIIGTTFAVTSRAPQVALVNGAASGKRIELLHAHVLGEQAATIRVSRYGSEIGVIELSAVVFGGADPDAQSVATVATVDTHTIEAPQDGDRELSAVIFDDATDEHAPIPAPIVVPPGSSLVLETVHEFTGDGPVMTFQVAWREVPAQPVAHIASAQLPAAGAFTEATYFDIPEEWSGLTFLVAYTAHANSTNARPKWRVSWSDGTSDFIQPVVSTSLDTSATPVAARDQYQLTDRWPTGILANTQVHFAVPIDRMPGATKVRLDIAELGDTTNRGTAAVTIVGA